MLRKLVTDDKEILQFAIIYLRRSKVLVDCAKELIEKTLYTQVINVKCDDVTLFALLKKKFKNSIKIIK